MRKIGTGRLQNSKNMYVTLNNKPIYLQMALDQSFHPKGYYTFPSDKFITEEILRAKKLDPTRLVEDNSPDKEDHIISDINSWHRYLPALQYSSFLNYIIENTYPGSAWNFIGSNKQTDIPLLNTECGTEHGYKGGAGDIYMSYEYHIMINSFRKYPKNAWQYYVLI